MPAIARDATDQSTELRRALAAADPATLLPVFAITPWRLVEYWKMTSNFNPAEYEMR